jgi:hypothetical protein
VTAARGVDGAQQRRVRTAAAAAEIDDAVVPVGIDELGQGACERREHPRFAHDEGEIVGGGAPPHVGPPRLIHELERMHASHGAPECATHLTSR